MKDAKNLYKASPTSTNKKIAFAFEHCWVVLKNQPKWSVLKERSKRAPQTPTSIDQIGSNDDDTMVLERPIGRKAEKAKRKRTNGDKGFEDYLAKNCNIFRNHMNKTKRLFTSKRIGFEWMCKELILKRKDFILKLLGRREE